MAIQPGELRDVPDEKLVVAAMLGDLVSFDELVRRYRTAVLAVARKTLGSREAAEDVTQDVFLLAFKALPQLEEPAAFPGWLCAITRHRARRVAARDGRVEPAEPSQIDRLILSQSRELGAPADRRLYRTEADWEVRAALSRLTDDHRIVLLLYYFEEWPVARISEFLSLPVTTVKWRLHQGRLLVRRELDRLQGHAEGDSFDGRDRRPGTPPHQAAAGDDGRCGAGSQPHRKHERRSPQLRGTVQPGAAAP